MVHQKSVDSHPEKSPDYSQSRQQHSPSKKGRNLGVILLLLVVLGGSAAILLEYYGKVNVVPGFGQGGRPAWRLGFWQPKDLSDSTQAADEIRQLVDVGVISGYANDEFRPEQPITRAEFASLVHSAFLEQASVTPVSFSDIPDDFWARQAIAQTAEAGFFTGYRDDTFRPEQPLTHAEALMALVAGLDIDSSSNPQDFGPYGEVGQISAAAQPAIAQAVAAGLVDDEANGAALNPHQPMTRAEAAALIYRARRYPQ